MLTQACFRPERMNDLLSFLNKLNVEQYKLNGYEKSQSQ